ncbi:MAG: DUF664 domain-containing protein [Treponema sp.]|jgi:uncharacterized damage-inducible protein DinB|nr:DUF664 domain-containing protein [Treponema sp.]
MKDEFLIFAKYNQEANKAVLSILDKLSNEEREEDRGSYYGSLSGLIRHAAGGTGFFLSMFKAPLQANADAQKAIALVEGLSPPKDKLTEEQWKSLYKLFETADKAFVDFVSSLSEADLKAPIPINWYGGNPAEVPLSFMLQNLIVHGTHHRGQISQILDSLKIDNDYSGINAAFLPR